MPKCIANIPASDRTKIPRGIFAPQNRFFTVLIVLATLLASVVGFCVWASLASAHENGVPFASWYRSLKQPDTGVSCCNMQDCAETEYRITSGGYEALYEYEWVPIPYEKILKIANPIGRGVLCISPITKAVFCFVPSSEG